MGRVKKNHGYPAPKIEKMNADTPIKSEGKSFNRRLPEDCCSIQQHETVLKLLNLQFIEIILTINFY